MADIPGTPTHERSQSATSLSRYYNGTNGGPQQDDLTDPSLDFCNAFWGQGDRGYEVIMTRLRGASKTIDDLRAFWKERAAIEEDYAKRLSKLAKMQLGSSEIGDLAAALQTVQMETASQASYHLQLSTEIHQTVEQPTAEFGNRLTNLKKGQQASIEKAWRNKGLQEAHVAKARDRYEKDCLKLNSYTANMQLVQGRERDDLESKMEKVRRSIGSEEQDFRNFVRVLEETSQKWENEWRSFCDVVQDLEDERLSSLKDIVWTYANAVSSVCVEDDGSCERVREKLEQFEPPNDMVYFVRNWGTGGQIPDPPRFINYGMGEYPTQPGFHHAQFRRLSDKPSLRPVARVVPESEPQSAGPDSAAAAAAASSPIPPQAQLSEYTTPAGLPSEPTARGDAQKGETENEYFPDIPPALPTKDDAPSDGVQRLQLSDPATPSSPPATASGYKPPFGMPLPGMAAVGGAAVGAAAIAGAAAAGGNGSSKHALGEMGPPPVPPTIGGGSQVSAAGPPSPSARDVQDEEDPMARALAELRRDPPGPNSVRRAPSQRRAESVYSATASNRPGSSVQRAPSPAPSNHTRTSYQSPASAGVARSSLDTGLIPPAAGHTAAQLAKSMAEFENRSTQRGSVNYSNFASDVVGAHPSSRPSSPQPARAPSPAMMQPPSQPAQGSHIADDVLPRYGQAFPGERNRSRPASVYSASSRPGSVVGVALSATGLGGDDQPREAFAGIGAGNAARSPSPRPSSFRAPSPSPADQGAMGPPNLGIALDAGGGVAHDSMAEQYRRQYEQQRMSQSGAPQPQQHPQQAQQPAYRAPSPQPQAQQAYRAPSPQPQVQQAYRAPSPQPQPQQPNRQSAYSYGQQPQTQSPPPDQYGQRPGSFSQPPASQSTSSFQQQQRQSSYGQQPEYGQPGQQQQHPEYAQHPQQTQQPGYGQPQQPYDEHRLASPGLAYQTPGQTQQAPAPYGQYSQSQPQQAQPQQGQYAQHSYSSSASYGGYPQQPQQQQQQQPPQPQQQPQQAYPYGQPPQQQQNGYGAQPQQQQYGGPPPQVQQQTQQQQMRKTPSPVPAQPPSNPAPTGQWAANGQPVLFYVRAVYSYQAQSPVEFDFQADDIIAVTSTPEDGWWSGELLDEARRKPGQTDFPSNFVELF